MSGIHTLAFGNLILQICRGILNSLIEVCVVWHLLFIARKMIVSTDSTVSILAMMPWMCLKVAPVKLCICKSDILNGGNLDMFESPIITIFSLIERLQFKILCIVMMWGIGFHVGMIDDGEMVCVFDVWKVISGCCVFLEGAKVTVSAKMSVSMESSKVVVGG